MASRLYKGMSKAVEDSRSEVGECAESMFAVALIVRTSRALTNDLDALLKPIGSSFARHQVLNEVRRAGTKGIPLGHIARQLFLHPATVTASVDRLEKEGRVRRTKAEGDRRTTVIVLTRAGKEQWRLGHNLLVQSRFGITGVSTVSLRRLIRLLDELMVSATSDGDQGPVLDRKP